LIKFAFSTIACPKWDFTTIANRAKEYGYDGVEVRCFLHEPALTAAVLLADPAAAGRTLSYAGVKICCLASSIAFRQSRRRDAQSAEDLRKYIDIAQQLDCPVVKIFDTQIKRPSLFRVESRESTALALGEWLLPVADYAAERDVTIAIENSLSFRSSKEMWMILESIVHPAVGVCWDVFNAALIGETPFTSVPVLNSRIQHVHVKDAILSPLGASYCRLGEGNVQVEKFITRLRGIGYDGWASFEWDKAYLPGLAEPEEVLPDAVKKLREWLTEGNVVEEEEEEAAEAAH